MFSLFSSPLQLITSSADLRVTQAQMPVARGLPRWATLTTSPLVFVRSAAFATSLVLLLGTTHFSESLTHPGLKGGLTALPCPTPMSVAVTPDGGSVYWQANTNGHSTTFTVNNNSNCNDTYTITYTAGSLLSGVSLDRTSLPVTAHSSGTVTATYSVGASGSGALQLKAQGTTMGSDGLKAVDYGNVDVIATGAVVVTPKGQSISVTASSQQQLTFDVYDTAQVADSFSLTCAVTGSETCVSVTPSTIQLLSHQHGSATLTYTSGESGTTGTVKFKAQSLIYGATTRDSSVYTVFNGPGPTPTVSLAPYSGARHNASAFDATALHQTPAYWSMGAAHALTVSYNASTTRPTPVVAVDVTPTSSQSLPTAYGLQVQIVGGPLLTLLNGASIAYYSGGTVAKTRLAAAIDAKNNGLTTGWYDIDVIVTSVFSGGNSTQSVRTRLLVDDESKSSIGAGWSLGFPRLYTQSGYSVLITEGDGSMSFFQRDSQNGPFISPPGDPTTLTAVTDSLARYRRTNLDGSYVDFMANGRLWRAVMPFNNTTTLTLSWTDTLLTSIRDVAGKVTNLSYTGGKLSGSSDPAGRTTLYTIDSLLRKVTEPNGDTTAYTYDGMKRLTKMTDNAGAQTDVTYDTLSLLASVASPSFQDFTGASVRQTVTLVSSDRHVWQPSIPGTSPGAPKLNGDSLLTGSITDPLGVKTTLTVDRFGLPLVTTAPRGAVTTIGRDTLGQPTSVTDPKNHVTYLYYTGYLMNRQTDAWAGTNIYFDYDATTNMLLTIRGDVVRQDIYYSPAYTNGPKNGPVDSVYSGNTGSWGSATGGTLGSRHRVNQWGQDTLVIDGQGHTTKYVYADTAQAGGITQVIDPLGRIVAKYHYDNLGRVDTSWTLAQGTYAPTSRTYDLLNRTSTVKNALGYVTQYGYSTQGLSRITDAKGQVYKFGLNPLGMLVAQHDLADTTKADTTKYDIAGRVRSVRTRRGDVISFTYDSLRGNLLVRSGPDFPVDSFRYDSLGRWMVATNANAYDSLNFDLRGRLTSTYELLKDATSYSLTYTYDGQDRLIARSAPLKGTPVRITYDPTKGVITKYCAAAACARPQAFDADNIAHLTVYTDTLLNAAWSRVDTTNEHHQETHNGFVNNTGTPIDLSAFQRWWSYDSLGRVTFESAANGAGPQYWYDAEGQIFRSCYWTNSPPPFTNVCYDEYGVDRRWSPASEKTYQYDAAANRADSLAAAVLGAGNRVTGFKGHNLTYDANGNVLTKYGTNPQWGTDSSTFTWDAAGRLKSVTTWPAGGAHTTVSFAYDALGRRVSKTVNGVTQWYAHDGDQVAMILDSLGQRLKLELGWAPGANNLAFVRGPSWTSVAMTTPQNGTVRGLVSPVAGAPVRKVYDSAFAAIPATWGDMTADTGTIVPIRMGGAEFDQETKLYYMRARYYDPQLGRFLSEDPIGIPGGLNLYRYAGNDPINSRDPTGLYRQWFGDCLYEVSVSTVSAGYGGGSASVTNYDLIMCVSSAGGGGLHGVPAGFGNTYLGGGGGGGGGGGQGQTRTPPCIGPASGPGGRVQALGLGGAVASPVGGVSHEDGSFSDGTTAGLYETDGFAIGYPGGGVGVVWSTSTSRISFQGRSRGFCLGRSILTICAVFNAAGSTWSLGIGPGTPTAYYIDETTQVIEVHACKP